MANQQLIEYIKEETGKGVSNEDIKKVLLQNGWSSSDIDEVFSMLQAPVSSVPIAPPSSVQAPSPTMAQASSTMNKLKLHKILQTEVMSGKTSDILILIIYLVVIVFPAFMWTLALGLFSVAGIGLMILIAIPVYAINETNKARRKWILLFIIYLIFLVYPVLRWTLALGLFSVAGIGLIILIAIPVYAIYKTKKSKLKTKESDTF